MNPTPIKYYRPKEVAKMLGYTVRHLRRLRKKNEGPAWEVWGPRSIRYAESELKKWAKGQPKHGAKPAPKKEN